MKRMIMLFSVFLILSGCFAGNTDESTSRKKKDKKQVSLFLDWTPNTNHTGIYVAKEKGFYDEAGLELEILLPGEVSPEQLVATHQGEFAISFQSHVTQARSEDIPIVSIAAIIQNDTSGYASPAEKGIKSPKDFNGKVYGAYGSSLEEPMLDLVMKRDGAQLEDVEIVQLGATDLFTATQKDVDFVGVFYAWTGIEAEMKGADYNFIQRIDYAEELNAYSPLIITSEQTIKEQPDMVKKFMEATAKGYQLAIENPDEATDLLIQAEPDLDPELVKKSQAWLADQYQAEADRWGIQEEKRWETYANFMYENDIIEKNIHPSEAFTNEFIPE